MIVSDAINLVQDSEIKQLHLKDNKGTVLGYFNMGILEIHKRFKLWQPEATINMILGTSLYTLDGIDANVTIDLSDNNLLKIDHVYDSLGGELTINERNDEATGVTTPRYNQIKTETEVDVQALTVVYRASPIFLTNEKQTIPLPFQFFEALFLYVGARGHASVRSGERLEDSQRYKHFERAVSQIKFDGLHQQDSLTSSKFTDSCFV